jgi:GT2 family glycosyltransferase
MSVTGVVVVNWNTREFLRECLASVLRDGATDVVVADNGSTDGSAELVAREFPSVTLLVNPSNPGYGAASNAAVRRCSSEYVLVLNSDTVVQPGALAALAAYLDRHPAAGIVGPRLLNPDGSLQKSCFPYPSPFVPFLKRPPLASVVGRTPVLRERYVGRFAHDRASRVPWILGAALGVRRAAFEGVSGFDESFVMYFEEVDLCYRLHRAGWEVHFTPDAEIVHVGQASTSQRRREMLLRLSLSSAAFYRRHHHGVELALALGAQQVGALGCLLRDSIRYRFSAAGTGRDRLAEDIAVWRELVRRSRPAAGSSQPYGA